MEKHTPGPWHIRTINAFVGVGSKDRPIATIDNKYPYNNANLVDETKANAKLIAAAPDLLEALKTAVDLLNQHDQLETQYEQESINQITDAIDKAEGTS